MASNVVPTACPSLTRSHAPMQFVQLHDDVLILIAEHLESLATLRTACTCKRLHVTMRDLAIRDVYFKTPRQLDGFISYVLSDSSRPNLIRSIEIGFRELPGDLELFSRLSGLLHDTGNLSCLVVRPDYEALICQQSTWRHTINNIPSLQSMNIYYPGSAAFRGFAEMRSRLRYLTIDSPTYYEDYALPHLGALERLEKLKMSQCDSAMLSDDSIWPTVVSLTFEDALITATIVVHAFPNVRDLTLRFVELAFWPEDDGDSFWSYLNSLTVCWFEILSFDYLCPVRQLTFIEFKEYDGCEVDDWEECLRVLAHTRPVVFSFPVIASTDERIPVALFEATHKRLRCLKITLTEESKIGDIYVWIHNLWNGIGTLPLLSFCLCIRRNYPVTAQDVRENLDSSMTYFHIPTILSRVFVNTQFIGFDLANFPESKTYWWCVVGREGAHADLFGLSEEWSPLLTDALDAMDETSESLARVERSLPREVSLAWRTYQSSLIPIENDLESSG
ncbi:unnamed protein product [Somion occarium]|uniref:F-box domain-containing protein n=1 Tax=Somion occarium TaxID=3059160 RepID=A0ABP1D5V4_9APHY